MLVKFRAAGALAANATTNTQAITAPACEVDDILIAVVINKALANVISAPDATWTQIYQGPGNCTIANDDHRAAIYWKRATASGGAFTFTKVTDDNLLFGGAIIAYGGCRKRINPLDLTSTGVTVTAAANANIAFPAFDPTDVRAEILYVGIYGNDNTTMASAMTPANLNPVCTVRLDVETNLGSDVTIGVTSGPTTDGSAIASRTWATAAATNAGSSGIVFGLVPEARKFVTHV